MNYDFVQRFLVIYIIICIVARYYLVLLYYLSIWVDTLRLIEHMVKVDGNHSLPQKWEKVKGQRLTTCIVILATVLLDLKLF